MLDPNPAPGGHEHPPLPAVVEMIMSALEAGEQPATDRRAVNRMSHRLQASLHVAGKNGTRQIVVYTRDADAIGVGFYSPVPISVGQDATLVVNDLAGRLLEIDCSIRRCRPVAPGWYEGAVKFKQHQASFANPAAK